MRGHTPGPWRISTFEKISAPRMVMGADDFSVASCDGRVTRENLANARLIAAAPDLLGAAQESFVALEALRLAVNWDLSPTVMEQITKAAKLLDVAIRKANQ